MTHDKTSLGVAFRNCLTAFQVYLDMRNMYIKQVDVSEFIIKTVKCIGCFKIFPEVLPTPTKKYCLYIKNMP